MLGVALWAWVAAPKEARVSVRWGSPPALDGTVGKGTGLAMWIGLGAIAFLGSVLAERDNEALAVAGAGLLAFLLLMEVVSVRRMTR
jgi:hypothetical protein